MSDSPPSPLLQVRDLIVEFGGREPRTRAVNGASFEIQAGETLGLVGASGSGKTTVALSILGLLPAMARASGSVLWKGRELLGLPQAMLRTMRGAEISLVPQDPLSALHPLWRVDRQVAEAISAHQPRLARAEALAQAAALLERMGIPRSRLAESGHPFEWSGGMRQRALIAMAIANRPALLIADEPTTALDVVSQAAVLELLREVRREAGAAMLLITHDLAVIGAMADRVAVMHRGRIVETGSVAEIQSRPRHPHTVELVRGTAGDFAAGEGLAVGPRPAAETAAAVRSTKRSATKARSPPAPTSTAIQSAKADFVPSQQRIHSPGDGAGEPTADALLRVSGLCVRYRLRDGVWRRRSWLHAVEEVGFELAEGETLAIVGESGGGKSSLARALVRLEEPAAGSIVLGGQDLTRLRGEALRRARAGIQIVFQDHYASLNPRRRVGASIAEPMLVHGRLPRGGASARIGELLEAVRLPRSFADRFPHELSGGERQRVAIARALALRPRVLVLDEPVTSLDAAARGAILRLLLDLQKAHGLAFVLIGHDLRLVRRVAHRVAVMQSGRFVEVAETRALFATPSHPYTRRLLEAMIEVPPVPDGSGVEIPRRGAPIDPGL